MLLTISLVAAGLTPADPTALNAPASIQRAGDELGETVRVVTKDRVSLEASYFEPRSKGDTKAPGVLLVHDAGSNRETLLSTAAYLQRKGFGVLTLDLRGHGESATDELTWSEMSDEKKEATWAYAARDLTAAGKYLLDKKEIHAANLTLIGVGSSCALALRHAYDDDATRAVVLIAPEESSLGFDVAEGIVDLGGLPTMIVAPKEGRELAETLQATAHEENDGYEYVTVSVMRSDREGLMSDKRLNSSFSKWLTTQVKDS